MLPKWKAIKTLNMLLTSMSSNQRKTMRTAKMIILFKSLGKFLEHRLQTLSTSPKLDAI